MKTRPNEIPAKPSVTAPRVLPDRDVESAKDRGAKTRIRATAKAPPALFAAERRVPAIECYAQPYGGT